MEEHHQCVEHVFQLVLVELDLTGDIQTSECIRCGAMHVESSLDSDLDGRKIEARPLSLLFAELQRLASDAEDPRDV